MASWLARLTTEPGKLPDGRKTLRDHLSKHIVQEFTPNLADRLLGRGKGQPPWLDAFIRVEASTVEIGVAGVLGPHGVLVLTY